MHFPEFFHQIGRGDAIPQLPASAVIHFSEGETHKTPRPQLRITKHAQMRQSIKNQMLINLVANDV